MKRSIPSSFGSLTNPRRRGVTIVLVGVFMPVLLGFSVPSVDVGYIHNLHAETHNLADAAAHSSTVRSSPRTRTYSLPATPVGMAESSAKLSRCPERLTFTWTNHLKFSIWQRRPVGPRYW